MEALKGQKWKHTNVDSIHKIHEPSQKIAVYDDEFEGQISLYFVDKNQNRWPIRSINTGNPQHTSDVLNSWACKYELVDQRKQKECPLP